MFSEEKLSQARQKKQQQSIGIKSFCSNTSYKLEYKKTASVNYLSNTQQKISDFLVFGVCLWYK